MRFLLATGSAARVGRDNAVAPATPLAALPNRPRRSRPANDSFSGMITTSLVGAMTWNRSAPIIKSAEEQNNRPARLDTILASGLVSVASRERASARPVGPA